MLYDLSNPYQRGQAIARLESLANRGSVVEISEKRQRGLSQNSYLHVCIGCAALHFGETLEYVKREYYKKHCNPDIFIVSEFDRVLGCTVTYLRSSRDLTVEQMTLSIERFRNWTAGHECYIPSADEHAAIMQLQVEMSRNKQYLSR